MVAPNIPRDGGPSTRVIVIGGGIAGLSAAIAAREAGAAVTVLEAARELGGNARLAAGIFLGSEDFAGLHAYIPDGDPRLQRAFCAQYRPALDWLENLGLPLGEQLGSGDFRTRRAMGLGVPGDRSAFMDAFAARAGQRGVAIHTDSLVTNVQRQSDGFSVALAGGGKFGGDAIIFATGGFAANRSLLAQYMGAWAEHLLIRSRPNAQGAGLRLARTLGATTGGDMSAFYGHTLPDCPLATHDWQPITPYFARRSVLVNRAGRRFTDESTSLLEERNPQAGYREADGRYWLVFDRAILHGEGAAAGLDPALPTFDWLAFARARNAPIEEAATLSALADRLRAQGVDHDQLMATLSTYNEAIHSGTAKRLDPPRTQHPVALAESPFYAMRCVAAITATCGGIATDDRACVLDYQGAAITGLYAGGVDAGGVYGKTYGGFLAWSLVSGRRAGLSAAGAA